MDANSYHELWSEGSMCENTTPTGAFAGPNKRPASWTPSVVVKVTARESASASVRISARLLQTVAANISTTTPTATVDRTDRSRTVGCTARRLLAQLHPLVPR